MDEQISVFEAHNNYLEKFMGVRQENSIKQRNETNIDFITNKIASCYVLLFTYTAHYYKRPLAL